MGTDMNTVTTTERKKIEFELHDFLTHTDCLLLRVSGQFAGEEINFSRGNFQHLDFKKCAGNSEKLAGCS